MGTPAITLDMSKSQPLPSAASAAPTGVTLDMSKSTPLAGSSQSEQMVSQGGQMIPADVAARHQKSINDAQAAGANYGGNAPEKPISDVYEGIGRGFLNEGAKTIQGVASLANKVGVPMPQELVGSVNPRTGENQPLIDMENKTSAEKLGGGLETIGEFATGDEVLKGISKLGKVPEAFLALAEKYPKTAKILLSGAKGAAVGGVQGGVKESAPGGEGTVEGATAGAAGGGIGGAGSEAMIQGLVPVLKTLGLGGLTYKEAMDKAGRATSGEFRWDEALKTAEPRLAKSDPDAFKTIGQFEDHLHNTANDIWNKEYKPLIEKNKDVAVDMTPIHDNIMGQITPSMTRRNPEAAKALEDYAKTYEGELPLSEAQADLEYLNAELKKYYKLRPSDQAAILKTNGDIAKFEAAADGIRGQIDSTLEKLGTPAPADIRKEYGAFRDLERTFAKRTIVENRKSPLNLQQVLSLAAGATEAYRAVQSGEPLAAIAGTIPFAVTTASKLRSEPASLVRQGIRASKAAAAGPSVAKEAVKEVLPTAGAALGSQAAQGVVRFLASDGSTHEINSSEIDKARQIDPGLKVIDLKAEN